MFNGSLIPDKTVVRDKGDGSPLDVSSAAGKVLLLTLTITDIIEQQSLDVAVWGSPDGANWGEKPLLSFPQKFYRGQHPLLLDLSKHLDIKFLRARWGVGRWGHHAEGPRFELELSIKEVPQDVLAAARAG
ncbi:MAG TPA: hypothetical protein VES66_11270 [Terriglobales bacterium]|nr:hypothetical protein [Terriglobales bacterium]